MFGDAVGMIAQRVRALTKVARSGFVHAMVARSGVVHAMVARSGVVHAMVARSGVVHTNVFLGGYFGPILFRGGSLFTDVYGVDVVDRIGRRGGSMTVKRLKFGAERGSAGADRRSATVTVVT